MVTLLVTRHSLTLQTSKYFYEETSAIIDEEVGGVGVDIHSYHVWRLLKLAFNRWRNITYTEKVCIS